MLKTHPHSLLVLEPGSSLMIRTPTMTVNIGYITDEETVVTAQSLSICDKEIEIEAGQVFGNQVNVATHPKG